MNPRGTKSDGSARFLQDGALYHRSIMKHSEPLVKIPKGRNTFSVSSKVNTKAYRDAFDMMPLPKTVVQSAYEQAGRILQKATGTQHEYLVAINARTGLLVADNLGMPAQNKKTGFAKAQRDRVVSCQDGVILLHNHPGSLPPSFRDVLTAADELSVKGSIVVGHDGSVWYFSIDSAQIAGDLRELYNSLKDIYGEYAEVFAVKRLIESNSIEWRRA